VAAESADAEADWDSLDQVVSSGAEAGDELGDGAGLVTLGLPYSMRPVYELGTGKIALKR
jgi:hypothetical protein